VTRPALFALLFAAAPTFAADPPAPVGIRVADFTLPDPLAGKPWNLTENARDAKATVVVFLATGCPVNNAYLPRLAELHKRFSKVGVTFVGVNSHPADDAAAVAKHAKENGIPFPVLKDDGARLADRLAVERVPTAYVLDAGRVVRYKGRIDDQFTPALHKAKPTTKELQHAIAAVLDGREVTEPFVAPAGCKLTREREVVQAAAAEPVTYHKHVSRIIQEKCQGCHRPGEAAPFSLVTYKQAKGWADTIREVVSDGLMPPWHADAPPGHFANDRRLAPEQKRALLAWIDQGCPEGDPADAPPPKAYKEGWRLGREPDVVLAMNKPVDVPAQFLYGLAGMPYQYVPAGGPFKEDVWVKAVEVRPDFRAALHHVIAFVVPPDMTMLDVAGPDFGNYILGAYVPGDQPVVYPDGLAKKVVKGSRIVFELHYTPNGKPGKDQSCVGLVLSKEPPKYEVTTDAIFNERFAIPPGAEGYEVTARKKFDRPVILTALTPHMHLRGKSFKYELVTPDGKREVLLNVPKWDFNWQVAYVLAKPRHLPAGSWIECTAIFDNSAKNPANPDPAAKVRWGQQTWEEMMIGFVEYLEEREANK
jgi:peroxiredoxin